MSVKATSWSTSCRERRATHLEDAAAVEAAELVEAAGGPLLVGRLAGAAAECRILVGAVLGAVDVAVADPQVRNAPAGGVAAELVVAAHARLAVARLV